jgi:hypothetical protein
MFLSTNQETHKFSEENASLRQQIQMKDMAEQESRREVRGVEREVEMGMATSPCLIDLL